MLDGEGEGISVDGPVLGWLAFDAYPNEHLMVINESTFTFI